MSIARKSIADLRSDLAKRFPTTQRTLGRTLHTGVPALDQATGGLPIAAVTEIVCGAPSCGGHLLLAQLLATTRAAQTRVALIDGTDSFDPGSFEEDLLAHLIWVRCSNTAMALQAADLLARDANLGLVVLDLRRAPETDLRRIPGPQWYRLQRAVEPTDLSLVVETPRASVPSAQVRFALTASHDFPALACERGGLIGELAPVLSRQRVVARAAG
jgi:hypothetical protein